MSDHQEMRMTPPTSKQETGRLGEEAAAHHYEALGYTVLARNYRVSHYELDLIAATDTELAFVEVKTRHSRYGSRSPYGRPADAVDRQKRARTVAAAESYLRTHRDSLPTGIQPRIDVVEVYMTRHADGQDTVERVVVFRNAFGARG